MKKIVLLSVSLILAISCLICATTANNTVIAGMGMGTNEKIEDADALNELFGCLLGENAEDEALVGDQSVQKWNLLSSKNKNDDFIHLLGGNSKYTSATITVNSYAQSSYDNDNGKSSQTLSRELTVYMTEDATFYETRGHIVQNVIEHTGDNSERESFESRKTHYTFDFDMSILVLDKETAYVSFKEFLLTTQYLMTIYKGDNNEFRQIKPINTNRWIEMPYEFVEEILDIDSINRELLSEFKEILGFLMEAGEISPEDTSITLNEGDFARLASHFKNTPIKPSGPKDKIEVSFNLASPTSPYIAYVISNNDYSISEQITIKNINNTVINFDKDMVDIKAEDENSFDKLFIIEVEKKR